MRGQEIIKAILENEKITAAKLGKDLGLDRPQAIYDILNGKTTVSYTHLTLPTICSV